MSDYDTQYTVVSKMVKIRQWIHNRHPTQRYQDFVAGIGARRTLANKRWTSLWQMGINPFKIYVYAWYCDNNKPIIKCSKRIQTNRMLSFRFRATQPAASPPCFSLKPIYMESLLWHLRSHDDVIKWKHFPRYWPFVRGIHRSSVNSPHKGQWRGALMFTLICARINGWQSWGWWFETSSRPLWRHCNTYVLNEIFIISFDTKFRP